MVEPTAWSAPASGGTAITSGGNNGVSALSYAGGYWFALVLNSADNVPFVRYATDPAGAWTTASLTMPPEPGSYNYLTASVPSRHGVVYGNGQYAFAVTYQNAASSPTDRRSYVVYATDPAGTWTAGTFTTGLTETVNDLIYANGNFIVVGRDTSANAGLIAYSTAANGTWTKNTSQATTGYATGTTWSIESIDYAGGTYVSVASGPSTDGSRYSTSLTSSWGTASGFPTTLGATKVVHYEPDAALWITEDRQAASFQYYYAADPSGTWTAVGTALTGMTRNANALAYGDGYWVAGGATLPGATDVPRLAYVAGGTPDAGTYTAISNPFTSRPSNSESAFDVRYTGGYFVALSRFYGEIRWCRTSTPGPTVLRQRQSPVRTPSRVRGVNLRQRQTPFIT